MQCVVAVFDEEVVVLGRCSVRVGCCVSLLVVDVECICRILMVFGGVYIVVTIE